MACHYLRFVLRNSYRIGCKASLRPGRTVLATRAEARQSCPIFPLTWDGEAKHPDVPAHVKDLDWVANSPGRAALPSPVRSLFCPLARPMAGTATPPGGGSGARPSLPRPG